MDPQTLMQVMMASQGGESSAALQQLAATSEDPTMRMIGTMLAQRASAKDEAQGDGDEEHDPEKERHILELTTRLEQAQETLRRMFDELDVLRGRNELLAQAHGACARCWGGDAACPVCGGRGHSGSIEPNPPLFAKFVVPALRVMADAHRRRAHATTT